MFVTVVIRALSRLPSRTARVRLELVPRAVVVAVALAQDARRASAGEADPGIPGSRSQSSGGPISSPSPPEAASPAAEGLSPRSGSPGSPSSSRPARADVPGDELMHVPGDAHHLRRAGDDHRRRRASRIEDRAPRASPMAPPKPPLSTEFPRRGRRVLARAARPGACPRAARGPRGSARDSAAATVAAVPPRDPVRWPPSSMVVAKRTLLRIQCDEECAPLTPSLEGRRLL